MLNSKEILEKTGISRATLNNYISWGIVPKPEVLPPDQQDSAAPRIGYFPDEIVQRVADIQRLKSEGWSMTRIAEHFAPGQSAPAAGEEIPAEPRPSPMPNPGVAKPAHRAMPSLSMDEIAHPAYMVNDSFEVIWCNAAARSGVLGNLAHLPPEAESHSVLNYLLHRDSPDVTSQMEILRFHLGLARQRGSSFFDLCRDVAREDIGTLERLFNEAEPAESALVSQTFISNGDPGIAQPVCLHAVQFREGLLFVYVPSRGASGDMLTLMAHRDLVIGDLVRKRLPVLTHVAVLVTDLQNSTRICSELPPEEYFELINHIWLTVDPIFRRHFGTHGKHAGDGMVYYFFPQPDGNYLWNALAAAHEMREAMRRVSKEWQLRKGWTTELYMNTGINEGQEWLGAFQSASHVEITVLGDTINHAARISDFARFGAVWVTKNLLGRLTAEERQQLKYGVRHKTHEGQDIFVASVFSNVENLADLSTGRNEKLKDIALLPITEVIEIAAKAQRPDRLALTGGRHGG